MDRVQLRNIYAHDSSRALSKRGQARRSSSVSASRLIFKTSCWTAGERECLAQCGSTKVARHPTSRTNQSNWLAAVENTHLICGQPSLVLDMLPIPDLRRFPEPFSLIVCRDTRRRPAKNIQTIVICFDSLRVKKHRWRFLRSPKNPVLFWRGGDRRARWRRGGGGQRWMDYVRGSSTQCVLPADYTRITACRLQASVVTRKSANTTPINKKKK